MKKRMETAQEVSVRDIAPLIASDGEKNEFGWQRDESGKALAGCRRPRLSDWLFASIPLGCFSGLFLAVGAIIFCAWLTDDAFGASIRSVTVGAVVFALISCAMLYRASRFRAWRKACTECGPEERAWHERFMAAYPKVDSFDKRLGALQHFSLNAEAGADIDENVVRKYAEERVNLDRELRTLYREQALRLFEKAVDESNDGRYRDTRDVTDLLFVHRARHDDADREITALTAVDATSLIRVTGTIPVSRPPAEEKDDEEEERAPDTLRSQRA